ncbi:extracellular serine carboxypeptidase [Aspergillus nomiae NRRL 13137]|uniref:Extracellular serine carboxypeptidase n=1 Tax=Aspergillus nomiae NRRL (strain ATCC 15546 / NRRL 13137 / CBS 260.88 / M93) TaxID=1509407 RepID=A0A0L1JIJ2_ASPN3|nr:extracellular serine carboxypeptidase [Aspergillus nomiae NRRL 13137]KNG91218.1 extracellular serine carboxypeptidase [Aspergillus nomiae NRRL 13137]
MLKFLLSVTSLLASAQAFQYTPLQLAYPELRAKQQQQLTPDSAVKSQLAAPEYPAYHLSVPVDHFHNDSRYAPHSNDHFDLRYWFDAQHYKEGGPVFVIAAGETDATARFPFLSQGIVTELAAAYHGIGVILEHRYYGESFPVENLTTENIRFLSTDQALADYAYFASNVVFPGLEHVNLTAKTTPWIAYGGSYAGAFVAFLRKLYPDVYWGAVSSSGVTEAIIDFWQYYEPIRKFGPSDCIWATQTFIDVVDRILIDHADNKTLGQQLKSSVGVSPDKDDVSFVSLLSYGLDSFQSRNWDSNIGSSFFRTYCDNITSVDLLYPDTETVKPTVQELIDVAGYDSSNSSFVNGFLNHIGFLNQSLSSDVNSAEAEDSDASDPRSLPKSDGISWEYQVCTEWGYFMSGASVPKDIMPLISRVLDVASVSTFCEQLYGIASPPNVTNINKHGGFNFSYPRVAIIDGLADPWRDATPHADGTQERESTDDEPFILIDVPAEDVWDGIRGAVHHWDQNGLSRNDEDKGQEPPAAIVEVQKEVLRFVGVWLKQWKQRSRGSSRLVKGIRGGPGRSQVPL